MLYECISTLSWNSNVEVLIDSTQSAQNTHNFVPQTLKKRQWKPSCKWKKYFKMHLQETGWVLLRLDLINTTLFTAVIYTDVNPL